MKNNRIPNKNQQKQYQKYDSDEDDHNQSDGKDFDQNSSDNNSANMGSSHENSDSDNENDFNRNSQNKQKFNQKQPSQIQQSASVQQKGTFHQSQIQSKNIQMTNLKQKVDNQKKQGNYNDESNSEEEIPTSQNNKFAYNNQRKQIQDKQQNKNIFRDDDDEDVKNKKKNPYSGNQQDSSDENDGQYVQKKVDLEDQKWKRNLLSNNINLKSKELNVNESKNTINFQKKGVLKQISGPQGKKGHVKLVEDEDISDDNEDQIQHKQDNQDNDEEEEEVYKYKTNRLKEEKEIRQRIQEDKKKEKDKKKKKKTTKFDDDDEDDDNDDDDEDDEDEDYDDYDDYDYDSENVRKREEYDISNTCQKWIGFLIIVCFMSILYYVMNSRGFTSSYQKQNQLNQQAKEISVWTKYNYPFDIQFNNTRYKQEKEENDRREEALCKKNQISYEFSLQVTSEEQRKFKSYLDTTCEENCEKFITYEYKIKKDSQTNEKENQQISNKDILDEYKCKGEKEVFINGKCEECQGDCHKCSQFTHTCYNCFQDLFLFEKSCEKKCSYEKPVFQKHFCIKQQDGMNLEYLKGSDFVLYLLHVPPLNIQEQKIDKESNDQDEKESNKQENKENDKNEQEKKKKSEKENKEKENKEKENISPKKYPFIVVLNDYRYTQQDIFQSESIKRYFDKAFILSLPFFNQMHNPENMHKLINEEIYDLLQKNYAQYTQYIEFYALIGMELTGQLANLVMLNQKENYHSMRFSISTATSENNFVTIISQDQNSFKESIAKSDPYFKDNEFCRSEQRSVQISSIETEYNQKPGLENENKKLLDHLDFYINQSFEKILKLYDQKKLQYRGY